MEISIEKEESQPALGEAFFRHARTPFNVGCLETPQEEKTCPFTKSSAIDAATQVK
jgi:hypothetical protein